jgi:proteic killer suppression protein
VIQSFRCKDTEKVFLREFTGKFPPDLLRPALRKLTLLHAADRLDDLRSPPGNRLEPLRGDRRGRYSIRINEQFRLCFIWRGKDAYEVEMVDYH